jgi:hypothetical protein
MLSLLLQEGPIETTNYMAAGYIIFFVVMILYLGSLLLRSRNLQQDLAMLEELEEKEV